MNGIIRESSDDPTLKVVRQLLADEFILDMEMAEQLQLIKDCQENITYKTINE